MAQDLLNDEDIVTELDISHLVIEDDTPVDIAVATKLWALRRARLLVG